MSEYTSTRSGFQRAMKESLVGKPSDSHLYLSRTGTDGFYHLFNGSKLARDEYLEGLAKWRGRITDYDPIV